MKNRLILMMMFSYAATTPAWAAIQDTKEGVDRIKEYVLIPFSKLIFYGSALGGVVCILMALVTALKLVNNSQQPGGKGWPFVGVSFLVGAFLVGLMVLARVWVVSLTGDAGALQDGSVEGMFR